MKPFALVVDVEVVFDVASQTSVDARVASLVVGSLNGRVLGPCPIEPRAAAEAFNCQAAALALQEEIPVVGFDFAVHDRCSSVDEVD